MREKWMTRSILAEIEFLSRFLAEGVANEFLVTFRAKVVAKLFVSRGGGIRIGITFLRLPEDFTDRFHVVVIEIRIGDLGRIVAGKNLHLDHIAVVFARHNYLAADITRH